MKRSLPLKPVISEEEQKVLQDKALMYDLVRAFGSPLNIVLPDQVAKNYTDFCNLFDKESIDGEILYAQKANKSIALLRRLVYEGSGTNNASLKEVQRALANGCRPEITEAGGPKTDEYILHSIFCGALINIDSVHELERVIDISKQRKKTARVIIRLSGFRNEGIQVLSKPTRFGIHVDELSSVLDRVSKESELIDFEGFSFHLDTVAVKEKKIALDGLVSAVLAAQSFGLQTKKLDIGGGYKVNYLEDRSQWDTYMTALRESLLEKQPPITWQSTGFGLRVSCGVIQGNMNMYSYYDDTVGSEYLRALLEEKSVHADMTFADFFNETRIHLVLEPGRALLNGAGLTIATVEEVRETADSEVMVRLDMNRADVTIQDLELFVDPLLIPASTEAARDDRLEDGCYLIGNLCLESDFISRRKVYLPQRPQVGDLMVFVNSAAYISDFNSHAAASQRTAEKVAVYTDSNGKLEWTKDEEYWPQIID